MSRYHLISPDGQIEVHRHPETHIWAVLDLRYTPKRVVRTYSDYGQSAHDVYTQWEQSRT